MSLDPRLEPLLAAVVRGKAGAAEVLHDAFVERGLIPLAAGVEPAFRLEAALALLSVPRQVSLGCAAARHALTRFAVGTSASAAIASLEKNESIPPLVRQEIFSSWRSFEKRADDTGAARVTWAIWMLVREQPLNGLRTLRALDETELQAQIDLVARDLGA